MAYDTEELIKIALEAITKHHLTDIEAISAFMAIDKCTYYKHKLNENNVIKDAIFKEKSRIKQTLKGKWFKSDNSTLQIALYKLIGSEEECHRLNGSKVEQKIDHTGSVPLIQVIMPEGKPVNEEDIEKMLEKED